MGSVNKAIVLGNLGKDPEIKAIQGGTIVANFSVATSEKWTDKAGQRQEKTEWHRIKAFGKLAELVEKYLSKGRPVYVEGRIETRTWEDRDTGGKRSATEIVATSIVFLGGGDGKPGGEERHAGEQQSGGDLDESDIPF